MGSLFRLLAAAAIIYVGIVVFGLPHTSNLPLIYNIDLGNTSIPIPFGVFTMPKFLGSALVIIGLWETQKSLLGTT